MTEVPQPTKNALGIYEVTSAIAASLIPGGGALKAAFDLAIRHRLETGERILLGAIEERGLEVLSEEQYQFFVPAAYRFYEQVRLGEYAHNLKMLSKLIAGELAKQDSELDVGKVGRVARNMEMLTLQQLSALARCPRAFEIYRQSEEFDGYWLCIDEHELCESYRETGEERLPIDAMELLHELGARGLLTVGGRPGRVGGHYFYQNADYLALMSVV